MAIVGVAVEVRPEAERMAAKLSNSENSLAFSELKICAI